MDEFGVFVFGSLIAVFLIFYAIGKWYPGSGAEQVDWRPTRSPEVEAELEMEDMQQMLDAQNERRRRTGRPEITEEDVAAQVEEDRRWRDELIERYRRESEGDVRPDPLGPRPDRGLRLPGPRARGGARGRRSRGARDHARRGVAAPDPGARRGGGAGRSRPACHAAAAASRG